MKEKSLGSMSGIPTLLGALLLMLVGSVAIIGAIVVTKNGTGGGGMLVIGGILLVIVGIIFSCGLYMVQPNQAAVISLFGKYVGTVKENGLRCNNPFYSKRAVSLRVRNFESGKLKVNELDGSPIEIAAVIVWQVIDASEAVYNVDDYESFVHIQSESALSCTCQTMTAAISMGLPSSSLTLSLPDSKLRTRSEIFFLLRNGLFQRRPSVLTVPT